jgi:hypothetical protein
MVSPSLSQAWYTPGGAQGPTDEINLHFTMRCARLKERRPDSSAARCETESMTLRAATVAHCSHAVLLLDQAEWQGSDALIVPPNITLLSLQSKFPKLNPVENVWQFKRATGSRAGFFSATKTSLTTAASSRTALWRITYIGVYKWPHAS